MEDRDIEKAFEKLHRHAGRVMELLQKIEKDRDVPAKFRTAAKVLRWAWEEHEGKPDD